VNKPYRRNPAAGLAGNVGSEENLRVQVGKENYFVSSGGYPMPARKKIRRHRICDLRYFRQTRQ
jgi:hypothetical protein